MTSHRPSTHGRPTWLTWGVVAIVTVVTSLIALAHRGYANLSHKYRLVPLSTFVEMARCFSTGCEPLPRLAVDLVFDGLGNVVVFVPLGGALALALPENANRMLVATLLGAALSIAFEVAQIWIPGRVVSTDDVLLNTVGTALGAWLAIRATRRSPA